MYQIIQGVLAYQPVYFSLQVITAVFFLLFAISVIGNVLDTQCLPVVSSA